MDLVVNFTEDVTPEEIIKLLDDINAKPYVEDVWNRWPDEEE